jgi:Prokaryotic E2 family E
MAAPLVDPFAEVVAAIAELEREFGEVEVAPAEDGGAYATVRGIEIGPRWRPSPMDLSFLVPFNFPFTYIYPFYTPPPLERLDDGPWPSALQRVNWRGQEMTQISLRPNGWQPQHENASSLIYLVQRWFCELA